MQNMHRNVVYIHIVVLENIFEPHYCEYHHVADNFKRMCHASLKLESNF